MEVDGDLRRPHVSESDKDGIAYERLGSIW